MHLVDLYRVVPQGPGYLEGGGRGNSGRVVFIVKIDGTVAPDINMLAANK